MNFVGSCTSWLCSHNEAEKQLASPTDIGGSQVPTTTTTPSLTINSTAAPDPGPSPGASNSCDDVIPPQKNCYRLVMLGSARVGKTCLVARFLGAKFQESYTPTIEDFHRKLYRIRGEIHQLDCRPSKISTGNCTGLGARYTN
ncbi:Ras family [Popillia japonica]|uniref:Ras family n=1 Tax=Popillia japonica TaxID=7064 RepID=A0AAW1JWJ4_POPJA